MTAKRIRWGILSTAKIALEQVIPAIAASELGEVVAISSRSEEGARAAAERLGIPRAHGSYEALLEDAEVDAIYNPLPNHMHVSWSVRALEAGKHVLCEKPLAPRAAEARELVEAGARHPGLKLMEAFMYRHHPQWVKARELVQGGGIGRLRTIQSFFSFFNDDPGNIRNDPSTGGGALLDIGCYPISLSRFIYGAEPRRVVAAVEYDPRFDVDRLSSAILDFGDGNTSTFSCSTQLAPWQRVGMYGTEGRVEIEIPFNAPSDRPCRLWHQRGEETEEIVVETANQYTIQNDLFCRAILEDGDVPTPIADGLSNMNVIEAIWESGRTGAWVEPA